ncbi:MAG TPA: hypothetical protein DD734_03475 [Firmicutes bacterium]|nr:hypothetical protein [Bacillota bacterium]
MSSNLPPGVTESMLPGNRPEDLEYEEAISDLIEELSSTIDHYRAQYPLLSEDTIQEVLLDLMPHRGGVIPKWQIEATVQKHIENELEWAEERVFSLDKTFFAAAQTTTRSRLLGVKMFVQRLVYHSGNMENLLEEAYEKVGNMTWQGPAA